MLGVFEAGYLGVRFLLLNHHLHGELWKHLRTDNSGGEETT